MISVQEYKRKVTSRFISTDPSLIGQSIVEADYYLASIKYDGHLGILNIEKGKATLTGTDGTERKIPAILKAAELLKEDMVLAGEICVFKDGKSGSHSDVSSAVAKPEKFDIRFAVFDIYSYKGELIDMPLKEKQELIEKLLGKEVIFPVEQQLFESRKDLVQFFEQVTKEEEGIVVRSSLNMIYKIKPILTLDLVVVGYALNIDGIFRDFLLAYCTGENEYQLIGVCGSGLSESQKLQWLKRLEPMAVPSEYTEVSRAKTAYQMVRPEIVLELSCLDVINEAKNDAVLKMELKYEEGKGFDIMGPKPGLNFFAGVIKCEREDKKPTVQDCGLRQFENIMLPLEKKAEASEHVLSQIIKREAYYKSGKGGTAVRKFVLLKTNKEKSGHFPAFALVYTDYSAGRKTPLDQDIFIFDNQKEGEEKMELLIAENIKKGWEKA
jgi:hypothetical protein